MTYRELLQAYKDGTLDEEKKKEIESAFVIWIPNIRKYEVIF